MAWVEQRGARWRVRYRNSDGTVGTDSSHATLTAADLRCKQVDIDQAYDTYLDPNAGGSPSPNGCRSGAKDTRPDPPSGSPTTAIFAITSCPASATHP